MLGAAICFCAALVRIQDPDYFFYDRGDPCVVTRVFGGGGAVALLPSSNATCYINSAFRDYNYQWRTGDHTRCRQKAQNPWACFNAFEMHNERSATVAMLVFSCCVFCASLLLLIGGCISKYKEARVQVQRA